MDKSAISKTKGILQGYLTGTLLAQIKRELKDLESPPNDELGVRVTTNPNTASPVEREILERQYPINQKQRSYAIIDNWYTHLVEPRKKLLYLKYVQGDNWSIVAHKISYSQSHTKRLHSQLIVDLADKLAVVSDFI